MRWGFLLAVPALFLLSAGNLSAQSRSATMSVSVTVVRSSVSGDAASITANTSGTLAAPTGSAEKPLPAPPRETEAEVAIAAPSSTEAASSVMMLTINY